MRHPVHGRRHMLVIVAICEESRLNESIAADHKSSKTFVLRLRFSILMIKYV